MTHCSTTASCPGDLYIPTPTHCTYLNHTDTVAVEMMIVPSCFPPVHWMHHVLFTRGMPASDSGLGRSSDHDLSSAPESTALLIWRELCQIVRLAVPVTCSLVLYFGLGVVNVLMVGHLGVESLAGAALGSVSANVTGACACLPACLRARVTQTGRALSGLSDALVCPSRPY